MIVVSGTKRSGTSMWMRLLKEAGFPIVGSAFPASWGVTIREANPNGFYESILREGIYHATNPHPKNGTYLHPRQTRRCAVKVFIPGLIRSDVAFLDYVIGTVRGRRDYAFGRDGDGNRYLRGHYYIGGCERSHNHILVVERGDFVETRHLIGDEEEVVIRALGPRRVDAVQLDVAAGHYRGDPSIGRID